jgi:hypothetical protein
MAAVITEIEEKLVEMKVITQMPIRIDRDIKNEIKIFAAKRSAMTDKHITMNDLIVKWIIKGFNEDKKELQKE